MRNDRNWEKSTYSLLFSSHLGPTVTDDLSNSCDALSVLTKLSHNLRSDLLNEEHPGVEVLLGSVGILLLLLLHGLVILVLGIFGHLTLITLLVLSSTLLIGLFSGKTDNKGSDSGCER